MKKKIIFTYVLSALLLVSTASSMNPVEGDGYFFTIRIPVYGGGVRPDYALFTAYHLREINIDAELPMVGNYIGFDWLLYLEENDWDMAYWSAGEITSPDLREYYTENGSKNIFRLSSDIPYNNESEELQNLVVSTNDLEERQQLQWNWQNLFMDKLLPLFPMFSPRSYDAVWANTMGYESRWGVADSLPYMYYDGFHEGQNNLTEFNIAEDGIWNKLNPLFSDLTSEELLEDFIFEPLLTFSPDFAPLKTGLIVDWNMMNNNHFVFELRDNVFWNPSFNTTLRNSTSIPLYSILEEDLMIGLKDEYSNGVNQQVTAKDAVFTLLAISNSNISTKAEQYNWLSNCYVDEVNDLKFHVEMDANPSTPEEEIYIDFWTRMPISVLPEFYLNSTNVTVSYTNGGYEYIGLYPEIVDTPEWLTYLTSAFGCGKYMLDYSVKNSITVLQKSPYWFNIGAIDGTPQDLDIEVINIPRIPDLSVQLAEFLEGKLDWVYLTPFPSTRKTMQADPKYDVQTYFRFALNFFAFNLDRPLIGGADNHIWLNESGKTDYTKALAIRKAISYAINRNEMNDELHDGEYLINNYPSFPIYSWGWAPLEINYNHDLDKAWEWMEAAGYERPYSPTPTPTPTFTSSETIPIYTTINLEILYSLLGIAVFYLLRNTRKKRK